VRGGYAVFKPGVKEVQEDLGHQGLWVSTSRPAELRIEPEKKEGGGKVGVHLGENEKQGGACLARHGGVKSCLAGDGRTGCICGCSGVLERKLGGASKGCPDRNGDAQSKMPT